MNSKGLGADAVFAWPTAQVAVMGAQQAVEILHRRELAADPGLRDGVAAGYEAEVMGPDTSAAGRSVDAVISPEDTRAVVARTLRALDGAREFRYRHDNMPLGIEECGDQLGK
jgi:acetyl-CoA carboxylase carboxyltransferase component